MSYESLKGIVSGKITDNDKKDISGLRLRELFNKNIIPQLGAIPFAGVANSSTNPSLYNDREVYYLTVETGIFPNFGSLNIQTDGINVIKKDVNGVWVSELVVSANDFIKDQSLTNNKIQDSTLTIQKLSQALIDFIGSGGSITNNPDDNSLDVDGNSKIRIKDGGSLGFYLIDSEAKLISLINAGTGGYYLLSKEIDLTQEITLPSSVCLLSAGGVLKLNSFNIFGNFSTVFSGKTQIFDVNSSGNILGTWNVPYVFPEWAGALGNNTANDNNAIKALRFMGKPFYLQKGNTYAYNEALDIEDIQILGEGVLVGYSEQVEMSNNHTVDVRRLSKGDNYASWPQGKAYNGAQNSIHVVVNEGSGHVATDFRIYRYSSYDGGLTWSKLLLWEDTGAFSGGQTAWSAGWGSDRHYLIVRFRGADFTTANSEHRIFWSSDNSKMTIANSALIAFNDGTEVPVLYHDFYHDNSTDKTYLGYHFNSGKVGILELGEFGGSEVDHQFYGVGQRSHLVEPTFIFKNGKLRGFLRTQNSIEPVEYWTSSIDFSDLSFEITDIVIQFTPVPIIHNTLLDRYECLYIERFSTGNVYRMIGSTSDVETNGFAGFKKEFIGKLDTKNSGAAGTGVPDGVHYNNGEKVLWFAGNEEVSGNPQTVIIQISDFTKVLSRKLSAAMSDVIINDSVTWVRESDLRSGWTYSENAGNKNNFVIRFINGVVRIDASLKVVNGSLNDFYTVQDEFIPQHDIKFAVPINDNDFGILWIRGQDSSGTKGRMQLLHPTISADIDRIQIHVSYSVY